MPISEKLALHPHQVRSQPSRVAGRETTFLHFPFWFALLAGLLLLLTVHALDDDRASALAAGGMLSLSLGLCLGVLRLNPLSPAMVYLYVFGLFHLGLAVPWALGIHSSVLPHWMLQHRLSPALDLVVVALTAFQVGATLAAGRWGRRGAGSSADQPRYHNATLYHLGMLVVFLGFGMFGWGIRSIGLRRFLDASYMDMFELVQMYDPRFFVTSLTFVPVGLYIAAAAAPRRGILLAPVAAVLWCSLIFFLGFRGFALIPLIVTLAVLDKRGFHLPRTVYIGALLLLLAAIPITRSMRNDRLTERSVVDAAGEVRALSAVEEMGGSLQPLVHTIRLMENEDLRWGKTYWQAMRRVLPNLALDWEGSSYVPVSEMTPTHWVTRLAAPWKYRHFGGLGFSAVAEPYMNFGTAGVAGYFLLLSVTLVWAARFDYGVPTRLALWATVLGPLLMTTRGSFDSFFRPVVWGWLIVLGLRIVSDSIADSGRLRPRQAGQRQVGPRRQRRADAAA